MKEWALISVYDKSNLLPLAHNLVKRGFGLLATGGTLKTLQAEGLPVTEVSQFTQEPERFGGRVKTLHHRIFGALLLRGDSDLKEWGEDFRISVVVCNFYPFSEKAASCQTLGELIEWIDIGGPSMIRAGAKNHQYVSVLSSPAQYVEFQNAATEEFPALRQKWALEAFMQVQHLDEAIVQEWMQRFRPELFSKQKNPLPQYGENPHQKAMFQASSEAQHVFLGSFSFNNLRDAEGAYRFVEPFQNPTVAVVKHQTLCGAAMGAKSAGHDEVFFEAWEGDPVSRFGGVLAFNFCPGPKATQTLLKSFIEVLVLPKNEATLDWAQTFRSQKEKVSIVLVEASAKPVQEIFEGRLGRLIQERDRPRQPKELSSDEDVLLAFGEWAGACSKSNAIALAAVHNGIARLVGSGQGQPNRVDCFTRLAWPRTQDYLKRHPELKVQDLVCFSDAFIPFEDLVLAVGEAGIKHIVQPGGSKADEKVRLAAEERKIHMTMTGRRHFWH